MLCNNPIPRSKAVINWADATGFPSEYLVVRSLVAINIFMK